VWHAPAYLHAENASPADTNLEMVMALLEGIQEGVAHVSTDGVILYCNARFTYLFGASPDVVQEGQTKLTYLLPPESWPELNEALELAARETVEGSLRLEDPEQQEKTRAVRLTLSPVHWPKATTIKVTAAEMTELMLKNQELLEKEESLHALSARIMQLQEEERRRIARDLHDITGQELAVVVMQLMQVAKQQRIDAEAEKGITDAASLVKKIEDEIRTLSYVLHPPLLDELGLGAALNWYVEGFTKRSGIEVKVDVPDSVPRMTHEKEMALFRVVQEALTNVLRHSGSHTAQIRVSSQDGTVALIVQDEGKGIGRKRFTKAGAQEQGVGIAGMRERLQQFGGALEVRQLRHGTEVSARVPVGEAEPIESPLTEAELLKAARALGYKGGASQPAQGAKSGAGQAPWAAAEPLATAEGKRRVLVVDDHEVTRQGVRTLLKDERDVEVCGEAKDAVEAVIKSRELDPDLIIMDLTMPGGGGFSAANRIRKSGSRAKILFFSTHASSQLEKMSRMAGFDGYVHKANGARDLLLAVRAVLSGRKFFDAEVRKAAKAAPA